MTILIKGHSVELERPDGSWMRLPKRFGIIHDPEGTHLPRCIVYFGPYQGSSRPVPLTESAKAYFGSDYQGHDALVDVPVGKWSPLGEVTQIRYYRTGNSHRGSYFHFFEQRTVTLLAKCKRYHRIELPHGCIVNWRGFVYP